MAIKIIDDEDVFVTREEMERLSPDWEAAQQYTTRPVSFETWLKRHKNSNRK